MDGLAVSSSVAQDVERDLAQALAAKLLIDFVDRDLRGDTEHLFNVSHGADERLRLLPRLGGEGLKVLDPLFRFCEARRELLALGLRGFDEVLGERLGRVHTARVRSPSDVPTGAIDVRGRRERAPSDRPPKLAVMQSRLFDQAPEVDLDLDPYRETRSAGGRLAAEFRIDETDAFGLVLGYGSEAAARRGLLQRWWRGEVELRDEAA